MGGHKMGPYNGEPVKGPGARINVREGPQDCGWGHSSRIYHLSGRNKGWGLAEERKPARRR